MKPQDNQENYWQPDQATDDAYPTQTYTPELLESDEESHVAASPEAAELPDDTPIQWTAKEYVHLDKGPWWYILFVVIVLGLIAIDILLLKEWTFSVLVVVMAVALIVYIRRPPRDIQYSLSSRQGLYVGERLYHLSDFKAFGLIKDGEHHSIMLIPIKRFAAGVSVYFPEEAGERIVDILGQRLPMENLKLDAIDVLVRKLRL